MGEDLWADGARMVLLDADGRVVLGPWVLRTPRPGEPSTVLHTWDSDEPSPELWQAVLRDDNTVAAVAEYPFGRLRRGGDRPGACTASARPSTDRASAVKPTIVEFLRARLDEDEKVARAATVARPWHVHTASGYHGDVTWISDSPDADGFSEPSEVQHPVGYYDPEPVGLVSPADAAHIARNDPARVLAEVGAKRAIVDRLHHHPETGIRYGDEEYVSCVCGWDQVLLGVLDWDDAYNIHLAELRVNEALAEALLRLLALPYAVHPDYRQEWAPR